MTALTKEEILAKSRSENHNKDLFDLEIQKKAFSISHLAFMFFCVAAMMLEFIFTKKIDCGYGMIFFGVQSVIFLYKYVKMHKLHELFVFLGYLAVFILAAVSFAVQLTRI